MLVSRPEMGVFVCWPLAAYHNGYNYNYTFLAGKIKVFKGEILKILKIAKNPNFFIEIMPRP
jgi:hypothetical protein